MNMWQISFLYTILLGIDFFRLPNELVHTQCQCLACTPRGLKKASSVMCVCYTSHIVHHAKSVHVVNGRIIVTRSFARSFSYICRRREFRDAFVFFSFVCTFFSSSFHSLQIWLVRWIELCAFLFLIVCFYSRTVCTRCVLYADSNFFFASRRSGFASFYFLNKKERKKSSSVTDVISTRFALMIAAATSDPSYLRFLSRNYFLCESTLQCRWWNELCERLNEQQWLRVCSHSTVAINWNQMTTSSQYGQMR